MRFQTTSLACSSMIIIFFCLVSLTFTAVDRVLAAGPKAETEDTLALQTQLVEALRIQLAGIREEEKVGARTVEMVIDAVEEYYAELENLIQIKLDKKPIQEVMKAKLENGSALVQELKSLEDGASDRFQVGEVTNTTTAAARAARLKAQIRHNTLKRQLAQRANGPSGSAVSALKPRGAPSAPSPRNP